VSPDVLAYRDRVVGLRAEIAGLKAEEGALKRNLTELDGRIRDRKAKIAAQEREKEAVTLEYATKKAAYEAFRSRYDQIASLTAQDLTFDSPNPEFQRLRGALIDAQAEEARLSARRAALLARINQVEARLGLLKDRVAKAQVEQDTVNQALDLAKKRLPGPGSEAHGPADPDRQQPGGLGLHPGPRLPDLREGGPQAGPPPGPGRGPGPDAGG
jgi:chromosome segregation ATPase